MHAVAGRVLAGMKVVRGAEGASWLEERWEEPWRGEETRKKQVRAV
jgi:hypothetical protein